MYFLRGLSLIPIRLYTLLADYTISSIIAPQDLLMTILHDVGKFLKIKKPYSIGPSITIVLKTVGFELSSECETYLPTIYKRDFLKISSSI